MYDNLLSGTATPAFNGTPSRSGYVFAGWNPAVKEKVDGNATYTAIWKEDKNGNGVADEDEDKYTVTYTDGVDGEEIFADQVYDNLLSGTVTPAFNGTPSRDGYTFKGWTPEPAATVTANATYAAVWEKNPDPVVPTDPTNPDDGKPTEPDNKGDETNKTPQTGDIAFTALWLALLVSAAGVIGAVTCSKKRKLSK